MASEFRPTVCPSIEDALEHCEWFFRRPRTSDLLDDACQVTDLVECGADLVGGQKAYLEYEFGGIVYKDKVERCSGSSAPMPDLFQNALQIAPSFHDDLSEEARVILVSESDGDAGCQVFI